MSDIVALMAANAHRWQVAGIAPKRQAEVSAVAVRLAAPVAKTRYQAMEAATGVPWFVVAVIHECEAGGRWDRQLGQGDPLAISCIDQITAIAEPIGYSVNVMDRRSTLRSFCILSPSRTIFARHSTAFVVRRRAAEIDMNDFLRSTFPRGGDHRLQSRAGCSFFPSWIPVRACRSSRACSGRTAKRNR
jgi:hypothetical protein